jgi:thiamine biosynthesis protein ThiI
LQNIYNTLKRYDLAYEKITRRRGRIYVSTGNAKKIAATLTRVFGISSVSPAVRTTSDKHDILQTTVELASETLQSGSSFAIRCHRVGKHDYSSLDICKEAGEHVLTGLTERKLQVNLTKPQSTLTVEVREAEAYVFAEALQGAGGFPVGSQGKVVCLLSGGIDSPVACWLAMKRGCTIVPVYFDNAPLTDETTSDRSLEAARKLFEWSIGYPRRTYIVPHGKNMETFMQEAPRKLTCIFCKRMMYRVAERIAALEKAEGIVTGEAIGEQASQTLINLRVLDEAARTYPIHRPLLGFDKTETEALARRIGTYAISIQEAKACTAAPCKPSTQARLEIVREAEEKLDIGRMVEESVGASRIVTV